MDIQLKASNSVVTIVFYCTDDRITKAKEACEAMKPILAQFGFTVESIRESLTKGHK
jgi:hypothetical protein